VWILLDTKKSDLVAVDFAMLAVGERHWMILPAVVAVDYCNAADKNAAVIPLPDDPMILLDTNPALRVAVAWMMMMTVEADVETLELQ
jgi:hypothetical protein